MTQKSKMFGKKVGEKNRLEKKGAENRPQAWDRQSNYSTSVAKRTVTDAPAASEPPAVADAPEPT